MFNMSIFLLPTGVSRLHVFGFRGTECPQAKASVAAHQDVRVARHDQPPAYDRHGAHVGDVCIG